MYAIDMFKNKNSLIFHMLCNHDFLTTDNLKFIDSNSGRRYERTTKLVSKGYLKKHIIHSRKSLWYLSEFGKSYIKNLYDYYFSNFDINNLEQININHSSKLLDIELSLLTKHYLQNSFSNVYSEKMITHYFKKYEKSIQEDSNGLIKVPDMQLDIDIIGTVAIELELTLKSKARYRRIYSFYRNYKKYNAVYWIYENSSIKNKILNYFSDYYSDDINDFDLNNSDHQNILSRTKHLHKFIELNDFIENGFNANVESLETITFSA